jgi:hypothetical protein
VIERLDPRVDTDVRAYEEGFYRAFLPVSNPGTRAIWDWDDDARRLRTRVPYEEQEVFFARDEAGRIDTACAFDVAGRAFQAGAYGFRRPPEEPRWVENLTIFNSARGRQASLVCSEHARRHFAERGYVHAYATCAPRVLALHRRQGWEVHAEGEALGVVRYLIRREVARPIPR